MSATRWSWRRSSSIQTQSCESPTTATRSSVTSRPPAGGSVATVTPRTFAIGVRQLASGRGIGTALLHELSSWAEREGVHRLELTVTAHNNPAIALYEAAGYELEEIRKHALLVVGHYVDELSFATLHSVLA